MLFVIKSMPQNVLVLNIAKSRSSMRITQDMLRRRQIEVFNIPDYEETLPEETYTILKDDFSKNGIFRIE